MVTSGRQAGLSHVHHKHPGVHHRGGSGQIRRGVQAALGIETEHRCCEKIRPRTTSRHESVRMLLMFLPFLPYNTQVIASYLLERRHGSRCRQSLTTALLVALLVDVSNQSALMECPSDSG